MLIDQDQSLPEVLHQVQQELKRATADRKHPFRYLVMSTYGEHIRSRYVVLRAMEEDFKLFIYTDNRSRKIEDLKMQDNLQLLFYHPKKQVQVILTGKSTIHEQDSTTAQHWESVKGNARRAYNTVEAPGTVIASPTEGNHWKEEMNDENFAVIVIEPNALEVLQLNKSEHLRASFQLQDDWTGKWLVP